MDDSYQSNGKRLLNKKVVITGAAGGMGHAMAKKFGYESAKLLLLDLTEQGLQETKKILHNIVLEAETYICDVYPM
ncbi:SDR family NAD(P)-dependent oxidoreductase [uncultured Bartonella sp.]|uniref:SDR family NAD(P)-dependent oxidoreductase n=1 Tax=uncultured Bartonella sp. TaxID=104108 RepID=UPI00261FDFB7|nr:SDR family NAD(P)-dependent oxidoreductase [uncultured Bartonella sp.]